MPPRRAEKEAKKRSSFLHITSYGALLAELRAHFENYSHTQLSALLGYRSKASVTMFFSGRRPLTAKAISGLTKALTLSLEEVAYLHMLMTEPKQTEVDATAQSFRDPLHDVHQLSEDHFSLISHWYNLPLFSLLMTAKAMPSLEWIQKRLRHKIEAHEIMRSLAAWQRLGFVTRSGRQLRVNQKTFLHAGGPMPSASIRRYHKEMIQRGLESVEEQKMDQRELGASTFTMDPSRIPEAKAMLERFREDFRRTFKDETAVEICQLNYQFFWHTELP